MMACLAFTVGTTDLPEESRLSAIVKSHASTAGIYRTPTPSGIAKLLVEMNSLSLTESDEHMPSALTVDRAKALIQSIAPFLRTGIPTGEVDSYYGEIATEWQKGDRILRLTCLSSPGADRLDYGTLCPDSPGEHHSEPANARTLVTRLRWLDGED